MSELSCWNCGETLDDLPRPISRHANCPKCFTEVHCCRMCRHFDVTIRPGQCAEERAEPPLNKEVANFCEWFEPRSGAFSAQRPAREDAARAKLDALFGRGDAAPAPRSADDDEGEQQQELSKEEEARARLEALFAKKTRPESD
jgi:hypothetical protein